MRAQDPRYALAVMAMAVANPQATADEVPVLENEDNGCRRGGLYQRRTPRCTHCRMDNHTNEECGEVPKSAGNSTGMGSGKSIDKAVLLRRKRTLSY